MAELSSPYLMRPPVPCQEKFRICKQVASRDSIAPHLPTERSLSPTKWAMTWSHRHNESPVENHGRGSHSTPQRRKKKHRGHSSRGQVLTVCSRLSLDFGTCGNLDASRQTDGTRSLPERGGQPRRLIRALFLEMKTRNNLNVLKHQIFLIKQVMIQ